ncbi:CapA family protein [Roseibacterium sp. SDUM158017]|uniref:CapA family protein n=1 Tax=Roseicyclus salinarum TaxID=3036773 RepID=UPI0024152AA3|nr:CapA family protein [Roseibacterium sp. SDUM158017]MDG4650333.1 CapA family protein [Roseibacterium sp. SDUM158017]
MDRGEQTETPDRLPAAPSDVLQLSSPLLLRVLDIVTAFIRRARVWRRPRRGSAAAIEEMSLLDNLYWVFKSAHPVALPPRDLDIARDLDRDLPRIMPPGGLEVESSVTLAAAGDILRSRGIDQSANILYERVQDLLFDKDISFANFESPVTTQPLVEEIIDDLGPPVECCDATQFDILKGHRGRVFDILNTANNHFFDMGLEGVTTTAETLAREGIVNLGANATPDEHGTAKVLARNGIRVGFVSDCFGLNGHRLPPAEAYRVHLSALSSKAGPPDTALLRRQIDDCRRKDCDFIVASIHWGHEFEFFPRRQQVEAARALVEYGADAIIGHHPHVIQPMEVYRPARDPRRPAVIAYSLGSLTWGFAAPHIALSAILNLRLVKGVLDGETVTCIAEARATPVFRTYGSEDGRMVTRIERLSDLLADTAERPTVEGARKALDYAELVLGRETTGPAA